MNLARQMGTNYVVVGVSLGLTANKVDQLQHDYQKAIPINFQILRTWRDNTGRQTQVDDMFDTVASAFIDVDRRDLHDIVRNGE